MILPAEKGLRSGLARQFTHELERRNDERSDSKIF